jgi:hypothetical protein
VLRLIVSGVAVTQALSSSETQVTCR